MRGGAVHAQDQPACAPPTARYDQAERRLWYALRDRRFAGWKFRRQETIDGYIVDFVCIAARLIIEGDGDQHFAEVDAERTRDLEELGYRVVRFWNNEVLDNLEGVLTQLAAALGRPPRRCD